MGFKGSGTKPKSSKAAAAAGIAQRLVGGGGSSSSMTQGTYRVTRSGSIIKLQTKRRKKGLRLPKYVQEQLKANSELTRTVSQVMLLNSIGGGHK